MGAVACMQRVLFDKSLCQSVDLALCESVMVASDLPAQRAAVSIVMEAWGPCLHCGRMLGFTPSCCSC